MKTGTVMAAVLILARAASAQEAAPSVALMSASHRVAVLEPGRPHGDYTFEMDAASHVAFVVASPVALAVEVALPDGTTLSPRTANGEDRKVVELWVDEPPPLMLAGVGRGHNTLLTVAAPPSGSYGVRVSAIEPITAALPVAITMLPMSAVRLGLAIPQPEVVLGGALTVSALLFEGERPVAGAAVTASVAREPEDATVSTKGETIELHDDGRTPDAEAGDGAYTGLVQPAVAGAYVVVVRADGTSAAGLRFERDAGGSFRVSPRTARLSGSYESEGAEFGAVRVRVGVELAASGRYQVSVVLRAENGREAVAQTAADLREQSVVDVFFSADALRVLDADGAPAIARVELHELTADDRILRDAAIDVGAADGFKTDGSERASGVPAR